MRRWDSRVLVDDRMGKIFLNVPEMESIAEEKGLKRRIGVRIEEKGAN